MMIFLKKSQKDTKIENRFRGEFSFTGKHLHNKFRKFHQMVPDIICDYIAKENLHLNTQVSMKHFKKNYRGNLNINKHKYALITIN